MAVGAGPARAALTPVARPSSDYSAHAQLCRMLDADCNYVAGAGKGLLTNAPGSVSPLTMNHISQQTLITRPVRDWGFAEQWGGPPDLLWM